MDVSDLRSSFAANGRLIERIDTWRKNRLALLASYQGATRIEEGPRLVLHLIPLSSMDPQSMLEVRELKKQVTNLRPTTVVDTRYNLDGFMTFATWPGSAVPHAYVQFFRAGQIEPVDRGVLSPRDGGSQSIPSVRFEFEIIDRTQKYLTAMRSAGVQPPIDIAVSLLDIQGYQMAVSPLVYNTGATIELRELPAPPVVVDTWEANVSQTLRPAFNAIWNTFDFPGSLNYDEDANWRRHDQR